MIKKFIENVKKYCDYLMTVNFGDLFINVLVLICILLLSTFMFVPVGLISTLIRDFIMLFGSISDLFLSIYDWIFTLISTVLTFIAFMYMFNKRFEDIEGFKKQIKEEPPINLDTKDNKESKENDMELPKEKTKK